MSIHDRDYYRADPPTGGLVVRLPAMRFLLTGIVAAAFLVQTGLENGGALTRAWMDAHLGLSLDGLLAGRAWQPVTSLFLHDGFGHLLLNGIGIFVFSWVLEASRRPGTIALLFLMGGIAGGAAFVGMQALGTGPTNVPVIGASGAASALLAAGVLADPHREMRLLAVVPVPLWGVGVLFAVMNVVQFATGTAGNVAVDAHLGGALAGVVGHLAAVHRFRAGRAAPEPRRAATTAGLRPASPGELPDFRAGAVDDGEAARIDLLLERIHAQGIDALSEEERAFLRRASQRLREKKAR